MAKRLNRCPVCEGNLRVTELQCSQCQTIVRGQFESCRFCLLPTEHFRFIETFLRCEGNLSRVERELGISYPTVRNRLQNALAALELQEEPTPALPPPNALRLQRLEILEALANGEMGVEEAAQALRSLM